MAQIQIGDTIPQFSLPDQNNQLFDVGKLIGKKNMVIYFYPKDDTPGCTAEACSFRDNYEEFLEYNCEVIGISSDTPKKHRSFSEKHKLPFILLSDNKKKVQNMFGVQRSVLGILPGRVTYLVDKNGVVQMIFNSQLKVTQHMNEALTKLKELE